MKNEEKVRSIIKEALNLVVPDEEEVLRGKRAEYILKKRLEKKIEGMDISYEFVGSYARNTWLKGNLEIDVFLLFPENYSMQELEKIGLNIGKSVVDSYELRYAAHPYVHGVVEGVEVDIVPCYNVKDPKNIKSAVDRTPFHHRWLKNRIKGKENEVRLLKGFLKAGEIYGAEYKVKGFSGYLCELLIVFFGSFIETLKRCRNLRRDCVIDIKSGEIKRGKSFFVVDPVDENRNVAANLSLDNLARFVQRCRTFLKKPDLNYFKKLEPKVDVERVKKELENRFVVCFITSKPDIVEDNLYTQLERGGKKLFEHLDRLGFKPLREMHFCMDKCYILIETEVSTLSCVEKRMGPPFEDEKNVEKFIKKCRSRGEEPFIENGRFWVYSKRNIKDLKTAIEDFAVKNWKSFGKNLGMCVLNGFEVLVSLDILKELNNTIYIARFLGLIPDKGSNF